MLKGLLNTWLEPAIGGYFILTGPGAVFFWFLFIPLSSFWLDLVAYVQYSEYLETGVHLGDALYHNWFFWVWAPLGLVNGAFFAYNLIDWD